MGVYKFLPRSHCDNAISALKDNHMPYFQPVLNNIILTLGTIIQINKFTLADADDRPVAPGTYGMFQHEKVY